MAHRTHAKASAYPDRPATPDALVYEEIPPALPGTIAEARAATGGPAGLARPLTLFLTVDTEDAYFRRPHLMTGEAVGREWGVYGILDELDRHGLPATFFVNVYETARQPEGAVADVVREIARRGHEVGLHTHPSPDHEFYDRPLFRMRRDEQVAVLRWGCERIAEWSGAPPRSFRAGGYALNDDTFGALAEVGIEVDSSCFFRAANNRFEPFTVNAPRPHDGVIEMPVTTVLRAAGDDLQQRKLDLDWLSPEDLLGSVDALAAHGSGCAMYMMHSFSFIEKLTKQPQEPPSERALFTSEVLFNRYAEVYGPKPGMREAFAAFLAGLAARSDVRVRALGDAQDDLRAAASQGGPDVVPLAWPG